MTHYYYLRKLMDFPSREGHLSTYSDEKGSVTKDPHDLFQKKTREAWRRWEAEGHDHGRKTKGLLYAVWPLPDVQTWSVEEAAAWAEVNQSKAEVHVLLSDHTWHTMKLAVHPRNPIYFRKAI